MTDERAKPVVLGLALAFIAGSYFRSDVFKHGEMASFSVQLHEHFVCQKRVPEQREECRAGLARALVPTKLSCLSSFRDLFVCQNPTDSSSANKKGKRSCRKEHQLLAKCMQVHLTPYGFSNDDVQGLLFGKQQLPPQEKPSLEVSEEDGGEDAGKGEKLGEADEPAGKNKNTGGAITNRGDDVHREGGKPKVEVEQESDEVGDEAR